VRLRCGCQQRRAFSVVEGAIILAVFLTLILGMIDLGLEVLRYNQVSEAARQIARQAIVHGSLANQLSPWSPASGAYPGSSPYSVPVSSTTDAIAIAIRNSGALAGMDTSSVTISMAWPDGGNQQDNRVQVTVSYTYQPMTTMIVPVTVRATSIMPIAH
jgi:Flp pilus assembly protein TadG